MTFPLNSASIAPQSQEERTRKWESKRNKVDLKSWPGKFLGYDYWHTQTGVKGISHSLRLGKNCVNQQATQIQAKNILDNLQPSIAGSKKMRMPEELFPKTCFRCGHGWHLRKMGFLRKRPGIFTLRWKRHTCTPAWTGELPCEIHAVWWFSKCGIPSFSPVVTGRRHCGISKFAPPVYVWRKQ